MSRITKRLFSLLLSMLLVFASIFAFVSMPAEAKASPKLSAKSVTLAKGGKKEITLKNGKGKWFVDNDSVVKIKSSTKTSVVIAPVRAGKAVLTCKVGKKRLTCKVKVLNNKIGAAEDDRFPAVVVGEEYSDLYYLPEGVTLEGAEYDNKVGKVSLKPMLDEVSGEATVKMKIKALAPGRFRLLIHYNDNGEAACKNVNMVFINGFRGKAKVKKTPANYRRWRKNIIATMASSDMTTWEMIDAIGYLICSGKYNSKGGATGIQLWYGGNGTDVSGAEMMNDFMNDLGIKSKIHFIGKESAATDIYSCRILFRAGNKDTWVTLRGHTYELTAQPGGAWPLGLIKRK